MKNLKLINADLENDIEMAKEIISCKINRNPDVFSENSMIYRVSNENMSDQNYVSALKDRKKVLSITASGDQIINSILFGGEDITGIDISRFPKYYVSLKLSTLKSLSKEEYLNYILGDKLNHIPLSKKHYEKIRLNLDEESKIFWDSIFNDFNEREINASSLFGYFTLTQERLIKTCPFLQNDNFEIVKSKLDNVSIRLMDMDLSDLSDDLGKFDLILLSNVLYYITEKYKTDERIKEYKKIMKKLPLKSDGIALAYNFFLDGYIGEYLNENGFKSYKVNENLNIISIENELIEYSKSKKNKIPFLKKVK